MGLVPISLFDLLRLDGLLPAPSGSSQFNVTFDIDARGISNLSVQDKPTGEFNLLTPTNEEKTVANLNEMGGGVFNVSALDTTARNINQLTIINEKRPTSQLESDAKTDLETLLHHAHQLNEEKLKGEFVAGDKEKIPLEKERLSQSEIDYMAQGAERLRTVDELKSEMVEAKNRPVKLWFTMRSTLNEERNQNKFEDGEKETMAKAAQDTLDWLDKNELATQHVLDAMQKELGGVVKPIMLKVYRAAVAATACNTLLI